MGTLAVLNVAAGDLKLSFDRQNTVEAIRAKRIITDMLRRGYALLVEVGGVYQRAMDFDPEHGEYIIADFDPTAANAQEEAHHEPEGENAPAPEAPTSRAVVAATPKKRGRPSKRLRMETARAVGIAPSAGG